MSTVQFFILNTGKPNVFSITTSQRVYSFSCKMADEMHHWINLINESRYISTSHTSDGNNSVS